MQGKARKTQDAAHKMSMVNKTKVANEKTNTYTRKSD